MTEKFEATLDPIPHYAKYKSDDYCMIDILFDIIKDGVHYDNCTA